MSPEENRDYLRNRYARQREEFIHHLGGCCVICGTTEELEIDHIDPREKSFDIGRLWPVAKLPDVYEELKKCQLLCRFHHIEKTKSDYESGKLVRSNSFTHGTLYGFMKKKCTCEQCERRKQQYYKERNKRRRGCDSKGNPRGPYSQPVPHGSVRMYRRGCKCNDCRAANTLYVSHHRKTGIWLPTEDRIV